MINSSLNLSWKKIIASGFFWVPVLLAFVDLAFYVLTPLLFMVSLKVSDSNYGFLAQTITKSYNFFGVDRSWGGAILIISLALLRILIIKKTESFFSKSLSVNYRKISDSIFEHYLFQAVDCLKISKSKVRKVLNAEINNLFFGRYIPMSFALAEILLVLVMVFYGAYIFGLLFIVLGVVVGATLFFGLYTFRKRAQDLGVRRSTFEQRRLEIVELTLNAGFSIKVNGGDGFLKNIFSELTEDFSKALSTQAILPFVTKAFVDAALVVFALILANVVDFQQAPESYAVLAGMALRVIPSLSRISGYIETIRINSVAVDEIATILATAGIKLETLKHSDLYYRLTNLPLTGLYVIFGASGVGKTSTIKQWISDIKKISTKTIAFLEQVSFVSSVSVDEYLRLMGLAEGDIEITLKEILKFGITKNDLSHLSGGQARFLQFLVLARKPASFYIFDEPNVGLDAGLKTAMLEIVDKLCRNALVIIVSHDKPFIKTLTESSEAKLIEVL